MGKRGYDEEPPVRIEGVTCIDESPKAIKVVIDKDAHWIPKSQVHDDSEVYKKDDDGVLIISAWIAGEKGLDK
jgi:hypothetical protein